jgi:CHAT domain-containing protein
MVPSGASLRTLRQLPPGSPKRDVLVGFGDPYFTKQQAEAAARIVVAEASTGVTTARGASVRRRALVRSTDAPAFADLAPLPDTAEELQSIAAALAVDPAQALHLGKEANERKVKTMDLSRYRFVAFATHGLVPPQLGLTQPAIALTAPEVAGIDGDGLLTMEEVLALKLDADWVVLSACNSAAGAAEGAEAVSGLGRAFFYAGTRALLVTNWEVDSLSARDLVTGIFGTLARDPTLSRAEALRRAMLALMDGPGLPGQRTYAHPYFWAAYSVIGDGGGGR